MGIEGIGARVARKEDKRFITGLGRYVDDMVEAMLRMMDSAGDVTGPINAGNPQETPVRALAELIVELTGSRSKLQFHPLPQDDPMQRCPDITRARRLLDWQPTVELRRGLQATIGYFAQLLPGAGGAAPA